MNPPSSPPDDALDPVQISENDGIRFLHLGGTAVQSAMRLSAPHQLELEYTRSMMGFLLFKLHPRDIALIGLGGGSLAKFIHRHLPASRIAAVEIHPQVISAARNWFWCPEPDSNWHALRRWILNPVRLPIPPSGLEWAAIMAEGTGSGQRIIRGLMKTSDFDYFARCADRALSAGAARCQPAVAYRFAACGFPIACSPSCRNSFAPAICWCSTIPG
jgi:hypothetical protein